MEREIDSAFFASLYPIRRHFEQTLNSYLGTFRETLFKRGGPAIPGGEAALAGLAGEAPESRLVRALGTGLAGLQPALRVVTGLALNWETNGDVINLITF